MEYRLRHYTHYRYAKPVEQAHNQLRMLLRDAPGQQCLMRGLRIRPTPAWTRLHRDLFGNQVLYVEIDRPHTDFRIFVSHRVALGGRRLAEPAASPAWEELARLEAGAVDATGQALAQYRYSSQLVPLGRGVRELAAACFTPGRPVLEAALALNALIHRDFEFDSTATTVTTPLRDVLQRRRGVCQDFSHLLIAALRSLGLAARYVSGYIETLPPPGKARLVGADASHAWVSLWCGEAAGWQDLDPTNDSRPDQQHITTAWGRDYSDVIPLNGVISGGGNKSRLEVKVDVERR